VKLFFWGLLFAGWLEGFSQPTDSTFEMLESENHFQPHFILSGGYLLAGTPQLGAYLGFSRGWQTGLEIRTWGLKALYKQDYLPEIGWHFRRIWLASEELEPLRNSEYVEFAIGLFPATNYRFDENSPTLTRLNRLGYRPLLRIAIGKYWMPFRNLPWGMDANLVLGRYLQGHPPQYYHQDLLTATISFFWLAGWKGGR
jgi:hypothetical protein